MEVNRDDESNATYANDTWWRESIINMMKRQAGNNPVIDNAINMMEKGDNAGIEKLARNLCQEKGINPDDMLSQVKNQFGIK